MTARIYLASRLLTSTGMSSSNSISRNLQRVGRRNQHPAGWLLTSLAPSRSSSSVACTQWDGSPRDTFPPYRRVPYTDNLDPPFPQSQERENSNEQESKTCVSLTEALKYVEAGRAVVRAYTTGFGSQYSHGSLKPACPVLARRERAWLAAQNMQHLPFSEQLLHVCIHFAEDCFEVLEEGEYLENTPNAMVLVPKMFKSTFRVSCYDGRERPYLSEHAYLRQEMDKTLASHGVWTKEDDERVDRDIERMVMWQVSDPEE